MLISPRCEMHNVALSCEEIEETILVPTDIEEFYQVDLSLWWCPLDPGIVLECADTWYFQIEGRGISNDHHRGIALR